MESLIPNKLSEFEHVLHHPSVTDLFEHLCNTI